MGMGFKGDDCRWIYGHIFDSQLLMLPTFRTYVNASDLQAIPAA